MSERDVLKSLLDLFGVFLYQRRNRGFFGRAKWAGLKVALKVAEIGRTPFSSYCTALNIFINELYNNTRTSNSFRNPPPLPPKKIHNIDTRILQMYVLNILLGVGL